MNILEKVQSRYDYMVSCRRYLHENPDPSSKEFNTLRFIGEELTRAGIEWLEIENGGILGFINKGKEGPCILLRGDIDALDVQESPTNLVGPKICLSKIPGLCHACGHDAHTTMLLTEGILLNEMRETLNGSVILCFERGEEGFGYIAGIFRYLQAHKEIHIDTCYGCHTRWDLPVGKVCIQEGPSMSGVIGFSFTLTGQGGHGSRPDQANSALDCFHAIYSGLNMIRMRKISPYKYLTFSIGHVVCGTRVNVIPGEGLFEGTFRYFDVKDGEAFWNEFLRLVEKECEFYGVSFTYRIIPRYLPVTNPADTVAIGQAGIRKYLGEEFLAPTEPWMASESFGSVMAQYPSVFSFVGILNPELGSGAAHHTPEFDLDERSMIYGTAAAIAYTLEFMEQKPDLASRFTPLYEDVEDLIEYCCWN